jgi:hypothetical protein
MHRTFCFASSLLILAFAACSGSDLTLPGTPGAPASIVVVAGNGQEALVGTPLPEPLIVKVTDSEGNAVPAQQVLFVLAEEVPGAVLTPDATSTGPDGTAAVRWVLGEKGGTQQVTARVLRPGASDFLEVSFTASALVLPRGADRLTLLREPSATATAGVKLGRQPRVQVRGPDGSDLSRPGVPVTVAIAAGKGILSGTSTQLTDDSGRAEFADLKVDGDTGRHVLIFAADGYASVTSGAIDVRAAPANGGGGRGGDDDDGEGGRGDSDDGGGGGDDDDGDDDDRDNDDRDDDDRDRDRKKGGGGKGKGGKGGG